MKIIVSILFLAAIFIPVLAQEDSATPLTIQQIMQGDDFVGYLPEEIHWSEDGNSVYFTWNPEKKPLRSLYTVNLRGMEPQKVTTGIRKTMPSFSGRYNVDYSLKTYEKNGDIFLFTVNTDHTLQVTNTVEAESDPVFLNHGTAIAYRRGNNLYKWIRATGSTIQMTNFTEAEKTVKDPETKRENWIRNEELGLFRVLEGRKEKEELRRKDAEMIAPDRPREIQLNGRKISSLSISPDGRFVVYELVKSPDDSVNTKVPDYVTASGYVNLLDARPKVGSPQPQYSLYLYDIREDSHKRVDISHIPGIYDKPSFLRDYTPVDSTFTEHYAVPRPVLYHGPYFNPSGNSAFVEIRALDNKDRWFMSLNLREGTLDLLDRQHDDAWIGGPGITEWVIEPGNTGWIDDENIWFQSEASGFSHLYSVNCRTKNKKALTQGSWEVYSAELSRDRKYFWIVANCEGPAERHFYRLRLSDNSLVRITVEPGKYDVKVSPDQRMLAIRYSYSNKPWELYLMPNKPGAGMQRVTYSTTPEFDMYSWIDPEIIHFPSRKGDTLSARLYRPENLPENGPAVIFVHGAGYLQNVVRWWSNYFREYMFHNFLVKHGYTVLDIDYHGSEGYGRDWRTSVYRHMGGPDLSDQADGAEFLVTHYGVDPERIGLYGGSYGGFITIFAMFKYPGIFRCGAALRSVTDWAHYNHEYTSNRLNTPAEDSLAFKRSSPVYFADGLQGELLMLHGVIDTNVEFQDVVRLSQKLIELGKDKWNLAVFPLEDHGFKEASSWTSEYRRIFDLFERNLK